MATNFEKLQKLLEELFQLDQADLDFGIYRIMNQKRDEVVRFLEKDLLPQVKEAFSQYRSADKAGLQEELDKLVKQITDAGMNPDDSPKVKELRKNLADSSVDVTALENEVFSHLFNFFRRYYHEGDFISLRRYKEGVYAIPYEGEEVKLHWANHDQYYVKSSEYFRDYIFTMPSGKRVRVHLVAASSEQDNKKEQAGKERRFIICEEDPVYEENGEFFIRFEYRPDDGKKKQDALNQEAIERVLQSKGYEDWIHELAKHAPTKANPNRTVLEKHLSQYTARNTFDYFIHKDLGGFLCRELDFYIKNEVMHLDDIEHDTVPRVEQYLSKIKVIRKIAHKVIQFLEQLENFQKKLWLKKKFVVETNYCVTLDRVPEELYPEIAANDAQREEWVRLLAIDEIESDLTKPGYTVPLTIDFLKRNPSLPLDTKHFPVTFVTILLSSIEALDVATKGILVRSENFQALQLLKNCFGGGTQAIYIDPPFNLGQNADFLYRTDYKDSSWASLLYDRLKLGNQLLSDSGILYLRCDSNGNHLVRHLIEQTFGKEAFQHELLVQRIRKNVTGQGKISLPLANDSLFMAFKSEFGELVNPYLTLKETRKAYWRRIDDSAGYRNPPERIIFGSKFLPYKRDAHFKYSQTSIDRMVGEGRIMLTCKNRACDYEHTAGNWHGCPKCGSKEATPKYLVESSDTKILDTNWLDVAGYASTTGFSTENAESLLRRALDVATSEEDLVIDYFAGSGTTLAVAMKTARRWIGVEVADQHDQYILPRLKQVCVSEKKSYLFKYIRLETYEDALNNLDFKRTDQQIKLLEQDDMLREQYTLSYMLDVESRGSQSLLNVDSFRNPDEYKLRVERNGETKLANVDLVETFNWLLGLTVKHIDYIRGVRVIEGTNPEGAKVLVLWRNLDETDNNALDAWFKKQGYNTKDQEYDLIYVNGDNNLENLCRDDQTWKVRLIEEEFGRLMFDVEDV